MEKHYKFNGLSSSFVPSLEDEKSKNKSKVMFEPDRAAFNTYNFEDDRHLPAKKTIKLSSIHYAENKPTVMKNIAIREKLRGMRFKQTVFGIKKFSHEPNHQKYNLNNK